MTGKGVAFIGVGAVLLALGAAYSPPGRDLRTCFAVTKDAERYPFFRTAGHHVNVSYVKAGTVTLNVGIEDAPIVAALERGRSIEELASFNASAKAFDEFERYIRLEYDLADVEWVYSGDTNECP